MPVTTSVTFSAGDLDYISKLTQLVADINNATLGGTFVTLSVTGGGIQFPATQVASADPNRFDDYEEGLAAVTLQPLTSGTITLTSGFGGDIVYYTKKGREVRVHGSLSVASVSSPLGHLRLAGMPFTLFNSTANAPPLEIHAGGLEATATDAIQGVANPNTTNCTITKLSAGVATAMAADIKAGATLAVGVTFNAD